VGAGGDGELASRKFQNASTGATGLDRVEQFYDANNLTDRTAVSLAANGQLVEAEAETAVEFGRFPPALWNYPEDFDVGDLITVEADGVRYSVLVNGVSFTIDASESVVRPLLGRTTSNEARQVLRRLWQTSTRFDNNIT
jgi:hypothetical protein